ncbi:MAG: tRNA uridine-5-carboxymethylaminomethyl(34) synthesis GTPase MnmE [Calditerrivibrio sp.]|nr:tRNA uridine-5-carboxymethylaminomethyl(34) synthesis GTPase MnmE [Calditerrivibrio sp.]
MDAIVAPITPLLTSAVIVVRLSGDDLSRVLDFFTIDKLEFRKAIFCKYRGSELFDDVILTYFKAPNSFTGEDVIEVSFHGNPIIVSSFLKDMYSLGIRAAEPGEFSKRAFLNGKMDLAQSEAIAELINSKSKYSIQFSYKLLSGALRSKVDYLVERVINIGSVVEAFVEFPDEDLDPGNFTELFREIDVVVKDVSDLIKSYSVINHYKNGFSVVIAGKPNVGKSSLLNYLISQERSIVSDIPGTTRDYIVEHADLDGVPIKLIDTAGIRVTSEKIESAGIEKSKELINNADLVIDLFDASSFTDEDRYLIEITEGKNRLLFVNKSDLLENFPLEFDLLFSIKYNKNLDMIVPMIKSKLIPSDSDALSTGVMINERHRHLFSIFIDAMNKLKVALNRSDLDVATFEIGESLNILYEITGERYTEDILNTIFEKFCIGK